MKDPSVVILVVVMFWYISQDFDWSWVRRLAEGIDELQLAAESILIGTVLAGMILWFWLTWGEELWRLFER